MAKPTSKPKPQTDTPDGLVFLQGPVPPMLAQAIGYKGNARFVAFHWTPYGDEADYSDGRVSATGNWQAFLAEGFNTTLPRSAWSDVPAVRVLAVEGRDGWVVGGGLGG